MATITSEAAPFSHLWVGGANPLVRVFAIARHPPAAKMPMIGRSGMMYRSQWSGEALTPMRYEPTNESRTAAERGWVLATTTRPMAATTSAMFPMIDGATVVVYQRKFPIGERPS